MHVYVLYLVHFSKSVCLNFYYAIINSTRKRGKKLQILCMYSAVHCYIIYCTNQMLIGCRRVLLFHWLANWNIKRIAVNDEYRYCSNVDASRFMKKKLVVSVRNQMEWLISTFLFSEVKGIPSKAFRFIPGFIGTIRHPHVVAGPGS